MNLTVVNLNDLQRIVRSYDSPAVLNWKRPKTERWLSGDHSTRVKLLG